MDHDEIQRHIQSARRGGHGLTLRVLRACWPGGSEDRIERAALAWIRHWRPERIGATLPACSCSTGRCALCN